MSEILYDYSGIDSMAGSITSFVTDMHARLDEVDSTFTALLNDGWSGEGADAFHALRTKWHGSAAEMATTLNQLSSAVRTAAENMQAADKSSAASF